MHGHKRTLHLEGGCKLSAQMNTGIKEVVRKLAYVDVDVFKCFAQKLPFSLQLNSHAILPVLSCCYVP